MPTWARVDLSPKEFWAREALLDPAKSRTADSEVWDAQFCHTHVRPPLEWPGSEVADDSLSEGTPVCVWGLPDGYEYYPARNGRYGEIIRYHKREQMYELYVLHNFKSWYVSVSRGLPLEQAKLKIRKIRIRIQPQYLRVGPAVQIDQLWEPRQWKNVHEIDASPWPLNLMDAMEDEKQTEGP